MSVRQYINSKKPDFNETLDLNVKLMVVDKSTTKFSGDELEKNLKQVKEKLEKFTKMCDVFSEYSILTIDNAAPNNDNVVCTDSTFLRNQYDYLFGATDSQKGKCYPIEIIYKYSEWIKNIYLSGFEQKLNKDSNSITQIKKYIEDIEELIKKVHLIYKNYKEFSEGKRENAEFIQKTNCNGVLNFNSEQEIYKFDINSNEIDFKNSGYSVYKVSSDGKVQKKNDAGEFEPSLFMDMFSLKYDCTADIKDLSEYEKLK